MAFSAASLILISSSDGNQISIGCQSLCSVCRIAALHANGHGFGYILCHCHKVWHGAKRLSAIVLIKSSADNPMTAISKLVANGRNMLIKKLNFINTNHFRIRIHHKKNVLCI